MKQNVGTQDRIIRLVLGLALIILGIFWKCWFCGVIGLILLFTAVLGWCGLYQIFGKSTCKIKNK